MMRILLVADGRSAITRGWLRMLQGLDCRVSLVSTFPCGPPEGADLVDVLLVGFSSLGGSQVRLSGSPGMEGSGKTCFHRRLIGAFRPAFLSARAWLATLTLPKYQAHFLKIVNDLQPDIVHALRIPFEGMLAAVTPEDIPFIVSIWGNDLTFHARTSPLMSSRTRQALRRANGLITDARRDIRLARKWGLKDDAPTLVVPGSGGLDLKRIQKIVKGNDLPFHLPTDRPLVINPRGFRPGSVHQDTFFKSIPLVLAHVPDAFFICTAMKGQPVAERWVSKLDIRDHVMLLPYLPQEQLWQIYTRSQVYVSLSSHDGTPNTFLEALACGCFPVVGDIESLREWLNNGQNGFLVDPRDQEAATKAIVTAIYEKNLRTSAAAANMDLIKERADVEQVKSGVAEFLNCFQ